MQVKVIRREIITIEDFYEINEKEFLKHSEENDLEEFDTDNAMDVILCHEPIDSIECDWEFKDSYVSRSSLDKINDLLK